MMGQKKAHLARLAPPPEAAAPHRGGGIQITSKFELSRGGGKEAASGASISAVICFGRKCCLFGSI